MMLERGLKEKETLLHHINGVVVLEKLLYGTTVGFLACREANLPEAVGELWRYNDYGLYGFRQYDLSDTGIALFRKDKDLQLNFTIEDLYETA